MAPRSGRKWQSWFGLWITGERSAGELTNMALPSVRVFRVTGRLTAAC
jgi:hypothetical protein